MHLDSCYDYLYHWDIVLCFVQIVPGGMTNFMVCIDWLTSIDCLGKNGHFWRGLPTWVEWTIFGGFAHRGTINIFG